MLGRMKSLYTPRDFDSLCGRLAALSPDSPRRWGRMTAHGAVCHLADAFKAIMGEGIRPAIPNSDDVSLLIKARRIAGRLYALTSPLPWPKGVPTSRVVDQERDGTPPGDWDADMADLQAAMGRFRDRDGRDLPPHVLFGSLNRGEWGRWAYRHVDHHLRQFSA